MHPRGRGEGTLCRARRKGGGPDTDSPLGVSATDSLGLLSSRCGHTSGTWQSRLHAYLHPDLLIIAVDAHIAAVASEGQGGASPA